MKSKFPININQETALHKLMLDNGLVEVLENHGFSYVQDASEQQQKQGIDMICTHDSNSVNIDEKARFTIPLESFKINLTFALELRNVSSGAIGWFLDKSKQTDYYMLLYPVLSDKLSKQESAGYVIGDDYYITDRSGNKIRDIKIRGVMGQMIGVKKLRDFMSAYIDREKLGKFYNSFTLEKNKSKNNQCYGVDFSKILNGKGKDMYVMYSGYLPEQPLNLIVRQPIYEKLREFEFELKFK